MLFVNSIHYLIEMLQIFIDIYKKKKLYYKTKMDLYKYVEAQPFGFRIQIEMISNSYQVGLELWFDILLFFPYLLFHKNYINSYKLLLYQTTILITYNWKNMLFNKKVHLQNGKQKCHNHGQMKNRTK